jgi:signal transduction histidine kinase
VAPFLRAPSATHLEARLACVEFLLNSTNLRMSAQHAVEWLAAHAGVGQAIVAIVEPAGPHLVVVAEHGVAPSSVARFPLPLQDSTHPLISAMHQTEPSCFDESSGLRIPTGAGVLHGVPLRTDDEERAHGLVIVGSGGREIPADVLWLGRLLSRQVARLLSLQHLADSRGSPERNEREHHLRNEQPRRGCVELEQASAQQSLFLANMSHELRTPLNTILGYTHMLLTGVTGPVSDAQRKGLTRIDSNSRHLLALIDDLLAITRIETGRMPLNLSTFGIPELVGEVMSELEPIVRRSNLSVTARTPDTLPPIESDRPKVRQVVLNLLSNALKFTPAGSVVVGASYDEADRTMSIEVRDTGVGIPDESRSRVFEDFRQLDSSPARRYGGSGLGLSICRRLAEMLDGTIELESIVGQGSCFRLTVPARPRGH